MKRVFAQLGGPVAVEVLRLAADRGLFDSGLLECGDDGVGGAGSIGVGGLGVLRLRYEADVQDGEIGLDGDAVGCGDRERAIAGVDLELRLGWLLCSLPAIVAKRSAEASVIATDFMDCSCSFSRASSGPVSNFHFTQTLRG